MDAVVGREVQVVPIPTTLPGFVSTTLSAGPGVDIEHQAGGAAALRQSSGPGHAVVGPEEERAVDVHQIAGIGAVAARVDVIDQPVPAAVPSLFQSSSPWVPSSAAK